jgi:hypothetical protein
LSIHIIHLVFSPILSQNHMQEVDLILELRLQFQHLKLICCYQQVKDTLLLHQIISFRFFKVMILFPKERINHAVPYERWLRFFTNQDISSFRQHLLHFQFEFKQIGLALVQRSNHSLFSYLVLFKYILGQHQNHFFRNILNQ